ncbi:MAG TPA: DUF2167 domain-containing protein [Planctomycetota bacterium]|nr:DUF2167 domain-containing protein [Planctomycetota bacterium]
MFATACAKRGIPGGPVGLLVLGPVLAGLLAGGAAGQEEPAPAPGLPGLVWKEGPTKASLGEVAEIDVPGDMKFTGGKGTRALMEAMGNPASGRELGLLAPVGTNGFLVFEYSDVGYVKDDEKGSLDPEEILDGLRSGNEEANKWRKERGLPALEFVGWETKPHYDEQTQNLQWATRAKSGEDLVVNHNTRLLGRHGVIEVTLVCDPEELPAALPVAQDLLKGFAFKSGQRYAEYRKGDKVASYGLTALVVGGAAAAMVKSGLLAKLWKFVVFGFLALVAGVRRLFTGKRAPEPAS